MNPFAVFFAMNLRTAATHRPILAAVACAGVQFLMTVLILKAGMLYASPDAFGKVKLLAFASTIVLPVLLAQWLGLWKDSGFGLARIRPTPLFLLSLFAGMAFLAKGVHPPEGQGFTGALAMQFFNAFGEELLFRGVIFAILLSLPRWQAIVLSGALFGSMHLIHGVMDGGWAHAATWALWSSIAGMMFAAIRYNTGSLWLTIFLHMFINLCMIYSNIEPVAGATAMMLTERAVNVFELGIAAYVIAKGAGYRTPA